MLLILAQLFFFFLFIFKVIEIPCLKKITIDLVIHCHLTRILDKVDLRFVQIPFSSIPDSTITVSKAEISKYIQENKKEYEVEDSRNIQFVEFKEVASLEDEAALKEAISEYKNGKLEYNNGRTDTIKPFSQVKDNTNYINFNQELGLYSKNTTN